MQFVAKVSGFQYGASVSHAYNHIAPWERNLWEQMGSVTVSQGKLWGLALHARGTGKGPYFLMCVEPWAQGIRWPD